MSYLVAATLLLLAVGAHAGGVRVDPASQHLVDDSGRVRVFHGVNVVYKIPPYYPEQESFNVVDSLCEEDMKNLQSWGVNVIRMGVMWRPVENVQGSYNTTYLDIMRKLSDKLGEYDIWTLVDSHQDVLSRYMCGEGFPDWAMETLFNGTDDKWYSKFPLPLWYNVGKDGPYPNQTLCEENEFATYYFSIASNTAFQSLYSMPTMRQAFASYWQQVAAAFNNSDTVLGYELLNEPWPGDLYKDPLWFLEAGKQDLTNLLPLYQETYSAVRKSDPSTVVFYEPGVTWSFLDAAFGFTEGPGGPGDNDKQALAFHLYCTNQLPNGDPKNLTSCEDKLAKLYGIAEASVSKTGGGSMITEFGAVGPGQASADTISKVADLADTHLQSWAYWTFKSFHDITTQNSNTETFYNADGSLQTLKVQAVARTYAKAIAGQPSSISMSFDTDTAEFNLQYAHSTSATAPTTIYYSTEYWYPNGYVANVTPDSVKLVEADAYHLEVQVPSSVASGTAISVTLTAK